MKRHLIYFACVICFAWRMAAQETTIAYTYDEGGKLVQRKIQVMVGARMGNFDEIKDTLLHNLKVYPNPTHDYVTIEGELPDQISKGDITLMNNSGQVLKTDTYTGASKKIPVSELKPGIYLLEIRYSKKKRDAYKIIVTN